MDAMMQALLGGDALTDDDRLRQTADALRGSNNAAQVFSMSSIAPIAKAAQNRSNSLLEAAKRAGVMREGALRRMQDKETSDNALKLAMENRLQDREWQEADAAQKQKDALELQRIKYGTGGKPRMGKYEQRKLREDWTADERISKALDSAKANKEAFGVTSDAAPFLPDWTPNAGIEGLRTLQNSVRNDPQKQARVRILLEAYMNFKALAGANLSAREEARLKPALVNPNDSYKEVINKMEVMADISRDRMKMYDNLYSMDQYPRYIERYTSIPEEGGGGLPGEETTAGVAPPPGMDEQQQKDWDALSLKDQQELLRLREEAGR